MKHIIVSDSVIGIVFLFSCSTLDANKIKSYYINTCNGGEYSNTVDAYEIKEGEIQFYCIDTRIVLTDNDEKEVLNNIA